MYYVEVYILRCRMSVMALPPMAYDWGPDYSPDPHISIIIMLI